MDPRLLRYYGLRHTVVGGGVFTAILYGAAAIANAHFGIVTIVAFPTSVTIAAFTLLGTGSRSEYAADDAIEGSIDVAADDSEGHVARTTSGALPVFFFTIGVAVWTGTVTVLVL